MRAVFRRSKTVLFNGQLHGSSARSSSKTFWSVRMGFALAAIRTKRFARFEVTLWRER